MAWAVFVQCWLRLICYASARYANESGSANLSVARYRMTDKWTSWGLWRVSRSNSRIWSGKVYLPRIHSVQPTEGWRLLYIFPSTLSTQWWWYLISVSIRIKSSRCILFNPSINFYSVLNHSLMRLKALSTTSLRVVLCLMCKEESSCYRSSALWYELKHFLLSCLTTT